MTTPLETLQADLNAAIAKHLPASFSGVLRDELAALEALRLAAHKWQIEKEEQQARLRELYADNSRLTNELSKRDKRDADFESRLNAVILREVKQDVADMELKMLREHINGMFALVSSVFKGPVWQRTVSGMVPVPLPGVPASGTPPPYHQQIPPSVGSGSIQLSETVGPTP